MNLVRNSPHNNGVCTFISEEEELVIKSSLTKDGIHSLKRELSGYQWYMNLEKNKKHESTFITFFSTKNYYRIYIKYFVGDVGNYNSSISINYQLILKAINHYVSIWPSNKSKFSPMHGDFSVGNMIFNKKEVIIIDWEHFAMNSAPWGFDLVNMLYESVYFSMRGSENLKINEQKMFLKLRNIILQLLKEVPEFKCTLDDLTTFIYKNDLFWGKLIKKLPVLNFTTGQRKFIKTLEI